MTRNAARYLLLPAAIGTALAACSGSDSDPALTGDDAATLSISLMDAPVDDVSAVNLVITGLLLKAEGDGPAEELPLSETPFEVDMLTLTDDNAALLVDNALIAPGNYEWLRMTVNAEIDGSVADSNVVIEADGGVRELFVPSGRVQLIGGFEAGPNESIALSFDWNLREGLVHPPGLGGAGQDVYLLKPTIRVLGTTVYARLSGTITMDTVMHPDNDCNADVEGGDYDVGNAVYVFEGFDVVPDDIDEEADVTPLTTVTAELSEDSTGYEYATSLPEGNYTVAFSCQAANDLAESNETGNEDPLDDTVAFLASGVNVTIPGDEDDGGVIVNFSE
jgi:hypothetical protein